MHHKKLLNCLLLLSVEFKNFFKSRPFLVFLGDDELHVRCDRPLYADRLIVPCKSALVTRMIEIGALVGKLCLVGENDKAVCETFRNVELFLVLPYVLECVLKSTATSKTVPRTARTSLPCGNCFWK